MRTLCVAGVYPWPARDGYRQRLAHTVEAFVPLGEVDFACFTAAVGPSELPPPDGIRVIRGLTDVVPRLERVRDWAVGDQPRAMYRYGMAAANAKVGAELADHYDLIFYSHITSWVLHGSLATAPAVVDLDNLEHLINRAARTTVPATRQWRVWAKWLATQPVEWIDEGRMARLQNKSAAAVHTVTLCSELDAERSGLANVVVVPNGYDRVGEPPADRSGSTIIFVGNLSYAPNGDAVRWFATDILPLVRREVPDATFRVVGGGGGGFAEIRDQPGVSLAGRVAELQPELDAAAIAVVPIRFGSGTRLKVVEALANRLPMASTTLGSEGIGVIDGTSALLADDAPGLAAACVRLLRQPDVGAKLALEGERLWDRQYRWSRVRADLAALGAEVAAGPS